MLSRWCNICCSRLLICLQLGPLEVWRGPWTGVDRLRGCHSMMIWRRWRLLIGLQLVTLDVSNGQQLVTLDVSSVQINY